MRELAKKRLAANAKQSLHYLSLVFNDFFILALIFLVGALMFWYAKALKTMPVGQGFYQPVLALLLWLPTLTGSLVTLLEPADRHFLLTQDRNLKAYLRPLFYYSLAWPTILLVLLAGILFPFATLKVPLAWGIYLTIVLLVWLLKVGQLLLQKQRLYFGRFIPVWGYNLLTLAIIWLLLSFHIVGFVLFCLLAVFLLVSEKQTAPIFNWLLAIKIETNRKENVYTFYSLFTDVEEKQIVIKRHRWLDFLLPHRLSWETPQTFLYRRTLLRNPEYLNLLVRMTVFAGLISWLVQDYRWSLGLSALVLLLTLYQLRPLGHAFDYHLLYQVMPISPNWQQRSLIRVLSLASEIQTLLIICCWAIVLPKSTLLWLYMIFLMAVDVFLVRIYVPLTVGGKNEIKK